MKPIKNFDPNAPKKRIYIGAWLLMGAIFVFLSHITQLLLQYLDSSIVQSPIFWQLIYAPLSVSYLVLAFFFTYRIAFKDLNGWRVLPWLYVIGSFGVLGSAGNFSILLEQAFGQNNADYYVGTSLISWVIALVIIRNVIVTKSGHAK